MAVSVKYSIHGHPSAYCHGNMIAVVIVGCRRNLLSRPVLHEKPKNFSTEPTQTSKGPLRQHHWFSTN